MRSALTYTLEDVTLKPHLWGSSDPVRPTLGVNFKTQKGRSVFALLSSNSIYSAFVCFALTSDVPQDVMELSRFTDITGRIAVPYTVWSNEKGAGRVIIQMLVKHVGDYDLADRVVTLSPPTEMAHAFHIRNNALMFRKNAGTVNFEYILKGDLSEEPTL